MNPIHRNSGQRIVVLAALLIAVSSPLLFATPQSGQTDTTGQAAATLPDAPQQQPSQTPQQSATPSAQTQPPAPAPAQSAPTTQPAQAPSGAAAAKAAPVRGAPAAEPAGAAVAPPRQHRHRSLLIKAGLLAGASVALGSVVALSERSPTRPPGTH